jgi:chemotaxis protein CheC
MQMDALRELINSGVGRAAGVLKEMTAADVTLHVPVVKAVSPAQLAGELAHYDEGRLSAVRIDLWGPFFGSAVLAFLPSSAANLVALLTGQAPGAAELDAVAAGTLGEVGNILLNCVMGSISSALVQEMDYSLPVYLEETIENLLPVAASSPSATTLLAEARFTVEAYRIVGDIILLFEVGSFDALLLAIDGAREASA